MTDYVTDREQIDMIKKWWNDYGKAIAIAIIVGLIVGFGWRWWHQRQETHAVQASSLYQAMGMAYTQKNNKAVQSTAVRLIKNYKDTPYASMASLFLAKQAVQQNDLGNALRQLQWVIDHGKMDSLKQIARIRAARILLSEKKSKQAMQMLAKIDNKSFQPMIENVKGDIYMAQGKVVQARSAYNKAKSALIMMGMQDPLVNMKIAQPKKI